MPLFKPQIPRPLAMNANRRANSKVSPLIINKNKDAGAAGNAAQNSKSPIAVSPSVLHDELHLLRQLRNNEALMNNVCADCSSKGIDVTLRRIYDSHP